MVIFETAKACLRMNDAAGVLPYTREALKEIITEIIKQQSKELFDVKDKC